ncbi:cytochrome b/b6 domain-containing protein [Microbacterium sp. cx-55]|uniref:cytochrome b/b6 domain-containing protein n=1 Tax=Microbacterium sp. cx-55 TaxID=2875948 RepID=UPI001CC0EBB8|nr:cytochrome b/b6 domain-containing protein [Microbacterium sp. cx-55]MBZ4488238.1 cytochrome b/b6 domain-containing protein [Microbacterium sp. cx-55]UGB34898.1 cytochrome b/b6 domain-containing protein [Microbacterium sp. cx-55]
MSDEKEDARAPLPFRPTVFPGAAASVRPAPRPEPRRYGPFTRWQWAGAVIVVGGGLLFAAAMTVLAARWLLSLDALRDFTADYPGAYALPASAPVGIPAWLGWQHFFNAFLLVLIIRSGMQVRREKRPRAFWHPRRDRKGRITLTLWGHLAVDLLWLVNGAMYVVLLFSTGQWMRIVPTSLDVFPNALSAVLQYASLDWPTENGWVNYNSVQQLSYFAVVFLAAPLATLTGVRLSKLWPKNTPRLDRVITFEAARRIHFPVMLFFVVFIVVHVTLVLATGALRNLNHVYAAQGSVDPNAYADNWLGFGIFVASIAVMLAGWIAYRPRVLIPIARLFGTVTER